jgi:hypothetical protein
VLDAAHKSIRSAAFDAAYRYLRSANESLPVLKAETWETNRENCQRICTLATAIASGLRDTEFAFSAVGIYHVSDQDTKLKHFTSGFYHLGWKSLRARSDGLGENHSRNTVYSASSFSL